MGAVRFLCARVLDGVRYCVDTKKRAMYQRRTELMRARGGGPRRIVLLLTPEYGNLGDHLIALGTHRFLAETLPGTEVLECSMQHWLHDHKGIRSLIRKEDLLLISGGGFLGTLWPLCDRMVAEVLEGFPENPAVILPQTFYCGRSAEGEAWLQKRTRVYRDHRNLYVCARDRQSLRFVEEQELVPADRRILAPDLALFLYQKPFFQSYQGERRGAAVCLRDDKEAVGPQAEKLALLKRAFPEEWGSFSTQLPSHTLLLAQREAALDAFLHTAASWRLAATDRLHGMISCLLTGTPCVVFDNVSRKLSGVHMWFRDSRLVMFAENGEVSGLDRLALHAAQWEDAVHGAIQAGFQELRDVLKQWPEGGR